MKKLILILALLPILAQAQYWNGKQLTLSDTTQIDTLKSKYLYTIITVYSSGSNTPDTLKVETYDPFYQKYSQVAVRDLTTFNTQDKIIISSGVKSFLVLEPYSWIIKTTLLNTTSRTVKISIKSK